MALFKCKMCGGSLEITSQTVATCEYCGSQQTLPRLGDDRLANLYDRANYLRRNNEFDKAIGIYELILNADPTDAEAYWSLVLCHYGIEYVEDPISHKRIHTVNRAQFTSIFDDNNYKSALQYADDHQRSVYESEAKIINEIQKNILTISQNEEPFDVFICYKETDQNGRRTLDSVLATDLYNQLTSEGLKVFFARFTLEDKLGSAYEPYIFAALNSAKVMVALGTRPEHFNAVWVKNEWSRYLSLIRQGQKKTLIPAYKDMNPYDLPEEFSHLQAQDMSKLGYMQDMIRGIKKILNVDAPKVSGVKENSTVEQSNNAAPFLKRAFIFLEDGDWDSANEYCEKVLDMDPECAQAYLGKLMSQMKVKTLERMYDCTISFESNRYYERIQRYGDEQLNAQLKAVLEQIKINNENARKEDVYSQAKKLLSYGKTEQAYQQAAALMESISGWKDADQLAETCRSKICDLKAEAEATRIAQEKAAELARQEAARKAKRNKKIALITVSAVCAIIAIVILLTTVIIPTIRYNDAVDLMKAGKYDEAIAAFEVLDGYKDSTSKITECEYRASVSLMDAGKYTEAFEAFIALDGYKDSAQKANSIYHQYTVEKVKTAKAGDYVYFGVYEQDNNTANGKEYAEWLVLEVKDGKVLVISKYALDRQPYNTSRSSVTWESCSLRKWLNNDFANAAFSAEERAMIPTVTVSADKNPSYSTNPRNATEDQIFLLSISEVNKYFGSDDARQCKATEYAVAGGAYVNSSNGNCWWWLRSPGDDQLSAAIVYNDGDVIGSGYGVDYSGAAVRPALWINLNS